MLPVLAMTGTGSCDCDYMKSVTIGQTDRHHDTSDLYQLLSYMHTDKTNKLKKTLNFTAPYPTRRTV